MIGEDDDKNDGIDDDQNNRDIIKIDYFLLHFFSLFLCEFLCANFSFGDLLYNIHIFALFKI